MSNKKMLTVRQAASSFGKHPEARPRSALRGKACWGEEGWRLLAHSGRRGRSAPQGPRGSGEATMSTPSTLLAYTDADVAAMLDVSRRTVYRLRKSGRLRAIRIGRAVRVPADAIAEFLNGTPFPQRKNADDNLRRPAGFRPRRDVALAR